MTLKTCLHCCLVRGLSLSWRSLFSGIWSGYPLQPQELRHYPPGLHWRGLEDKSPGPHHLSSILCLTSNLPMITSRSMIGTCETLDMCGETMESLDQSRCVFSSHSRSSCVVRPDSSSSPFSGQKFALFTSTSRGAGASPSVGL